MSTRTMVLLGAVLLGWSVVASCSDDKGCMGAEDWACYGNGTCNAGLDCRSRVCVNLSSTGFEDASGGGGIDVDACLSCGESKCSSEASACKAATGCDDIIQCMVKCGKD